MGKAMGSTVSNGRAFLVEITGLNHDGEGVGRLPSTAGAGAGKAVFVPGALPGELVLARVVEEKPRYARAVLIEVKQASPDRVTPACPLFGACGGCALQHLSYGAELRWKRQLVADALVHLGGFADPPVQECIGAAEPSGFRNKVQMPVARGPAHEPGEREDISQEPARDASKERAVAHERAIWPPRPGVIMGFYRRGTHEVVDVRDCLVQTGLSNALAARVRELLLELAVEPYNEQTGEGLLRHVLIRVGRRTGEALVVFVTRERSFPAGVILAERLARSFPALVGVVQNVNPNRGNVILGREEVLLWGRPYLKEILKVGDLERAFRISARSFFQVNSQQAEWLVSLVLEAARPAGGPGSAASPAAGPAPGPARGQALDLYCGAGTLTLFLAARFAEAVGIEEVEEAVADGRANARLNGLKNVRFIAGKVEEVLPRLAAGKGDLVPEVVVIDPPRAGVEPAALAAIRRLAPPRLVYVSCNPATLARDLRFLTGHADTTGRQSRAQRRDGSADGPLYRLERVTPVDMFPRTAHVESIAVLTRRG